MAQEPQPPSALFSHIDVSAHAGSPSDDGVTNSDIAILLKHLVAGQDRQNELLEELVQQTSAAQKQRAGELNQWKESNPHLARRCRMAAEALSGVQSEFLRNLTDEVTDNSEGMMDGEFLMNEFVDRFGPRLAHLNGVLQVLSQLSAAPNSHR